MLIAAAVKKSTSPHPSHRPVAEADYEHLAAFRHTLREFLRFSEEAALAAGIAPQQHQAMLAIRGCAERRDHLTVGELAEHLKIRHHSAVGLVNRMAAERLVRKSGDPDNHRQVLVRLAPRGLRKLERLSPVHKAELARIGPALRKILNQLEAAS